MPATYFTLDEVAKRMKSAPLSLEKSVEKLCKAGFKASQTSLNPSGFRTDATMSEILGVFQN